MKMLNKFEDDPTYFEEQRLKCRDDLENSNIEQ